MAKKKLASHVQNQHQTKNKINFIVHVVNVNHEETWTVSELMDAKKKITLFSYFRIANTNYLSKVMYWYLKEKILQKKLQLRCKHPL